MIMPRGCLLYTSAKETSRLIPMTHPIAITGVTVDFRVMPPDMIAIEAAVRTTDRTGIEMEALTAVSVAALTIYDMCKAVDRSMCIQGIRLLKKSGGKSGEFYREGETIWEK